MSDPRLVDVRLIEHYSTAKAYLVSADGDADAAVWLAKSQVERYDATKMPEAGNLASYEYAMPEWLAKKEDLV